MHTIEVCRIGGGGAGHVLWGGKGGATLLLLIFGLWSLDNVKLFALPLPVIDVCNNNINIL